MTEQLKLLVVEETYNLNNLRDVCRDYVKKKFPSPVEEEDYDEYNKMLSDESDLEFAYRLRKIAEQIEDRVLNPMKKEIREVYKDLTKDKKDSIIK